MGKIVSSKKRTKEMVARRLTYSILDSPWNFLSKKKKKKKKKEIFQKTLFNNLYPLFSSTHVFL